MRSAYLIFTYYVFHMVMANTPLGDSWTPLQYGVCTVSGEVEVVGSTSQGNTCNFDGAGSKYMPSLWTNKYLLAVSQDLYNGFHTADDFKTDCLTTDQTADSTDKNCGQICGTCFFISGPNGDAVYMANEIADINAVGDNGRGINLHIDDDTIKQVRSGLGLGYDIDYKRVPCPGTENGIYFFFTQYNADQDWKNAIYFTPINYKIAVKGMWVRHGQNATDRNWYRLPRSWTNQYKYESYGCDKCPSWQNGLGSIYGDNGAYSFDMKIVSQLDEEIICYELTVDKGVQQATIQCFNKVGECQQFGDNGYTLDYTSCSGETDIVAPPGVTCSKTNQSSASVTTTIPIIITLCSIIVLIHE